MPRFAVLAHQWNGLHWDFLVEDAGGASLRTWAIDEPIVPDKPLQARALPPHRPIYLDYEGPISSGRGTVERFDRGEADVIAWTPDRVELIVRGDQLNGRVAIWNDSRAGAGNSADGTDWRFLLKNRD